MRAWRPAATAATTPGLASTNHYQAFAQLCLLLLGFTTLLFPSLGHNNTPNGPIKERTQLSLGSDDPNGIQLSAPTVANGFAKTTNKVLTPEMVNLGIKVAALFLSIAPSVSLPSNSPVKVMSYAVRGPLAIRAVELEKEIKAVKTEKLPSCEYIYVQYPPITNI